MTLSPEITAHADKVLAHIHDCIAKAGGWLAFDRYMHEALYAPGLGYYVAGKRKFGAEGDFITAPELGELFAACIARQCTEVLAETGGDILEFGAGSGALAAGVLHTLAEMESLPEKYAILEVSPDLRALQEETLARELGGELAGRVQWLDRLPGYFTGVMLANEVLDAMPVKRFRIGGEEQIDELGVAWENGLVERAQPASDAFSNSVLALKGDLDWPAGYNSERCPQATAWVASLAASLQRGAVVLVDYGFPQREYYHPDRAGGTLMCHSQHRAHSDVLWQPGLQDITAHVNFTQIAEAGVEAGLQLAGFTSQAAFLLNLGLLEHIPLDANTDTKAQMALASEVKKLTLPHEMGELFKVIGFVKGLPEMPLSGFAANEQSGRL